MKFFFVIRSILFVFNVCMPQNFGLFLIVDGYRIRRNDNRKTDDVNCIDEISCHLGNRIESDRFVLWGTHESAFCVFSTNSITCYDEHIRKYIDCLFNLNSSDLGSDV